MEASGRHVNAFFCGRRYTRCLASLPKVLPTGRPAKSHAYGVDPRPPSPVLTDRKRSSSLGSWPGGHCSEYRLQAGPGSEYRLQAGPGSEYRLQAGLCSQYRLQPDRSCGTAAPSCVFITPASAGSMSQTRTVPPATPTCRPPSLQKSIATPVILPAALTTIPLRDAVPQGAAGLAGLVAGAEAGE
jgi:hypothetical protein